MPHLLPVLHGIGTLELSGVLVEVGEEEHGAGIATQVAPAPDFLVLALVAGDFAGFAQNLPHFVAGHARLDLAEVLFVEHLRDAAVAAVGADDHEVGFLAQGATGVFERAAAVLLFPDHLGLAHVAAHVGLGAFAGAELLLGNIVAAAQQAQGQQGRTSPATRAGNRVFPVVVHRQAIAVLEAPELADRPISPRQAACCPSRHAGHRGHAEIHESPQA